ncbi:hypothetical protein [Sinorhizobium alkalisoli]|uniref:hypothetical protein n=1 Tax=Sinorhizobium alkalisoli TaxID=1752398 RepID=UPI000ACC5DB0|nr:hypothetical protein [Sinorhizobium alkalisoli]MCA1490876.1 hypothetical protein [Ensifer sp. NBAIM29]MCG5479610.1 hypothetical protein [Sinorhizobium alkalisoli]QFI67174.1 hypothetical protein EKH55_2300 [Sinorhizobium alkalisoli]
MQGQSVREISAAERQLRPLVVIVVAANFAVTALLLTTVQLAPPAPAPGIVALR